MVLDDAFDALANRHRRRILVELLERNPRDDRTMVPEDVEAGDVAMDELQVAFHHVHLPRLEENGYVRWDREAHEVVAGPRFEEIRSLLELLDENVEELQTTWP